MDDRRAYHKLENGFCRLTLLLDELRTLFAHETVHTHFLVMKLELVGVVELRSFLDVRKL